MLLNIKEAYSDKVILKHIVYANKIKATNPVKEINDALYREFKEALKACLAYDGIGIAANQIGIQKSFFLIREESESDLFRVYINPKFKAATTEKNTAKEGCLSVPRQQLLVPRFTEIKATWQEIIDDKFVDCEEVLTGFKAIAYQHEKDHLEGVSIIDKTVELNREGKRRLLNDLRS